MKNFLLFVAIITASFFTSCGNKEEKKEEVEKEKPFTVEMQIIVEQDDVICLYYKDNSISFFSEDMGIYKNLTKSKEVQNIIFELPENFVPNDFRFDLSHQNKEQTMTIKNIVFSNKNNNFNIEGKDLFKYLKANEGIVSNLNVFTFKNNEDGSYDPFLSTTGDFYPLLEVLVGYNAFVETKQ